MRVLHLVECLGRARGRGATSDAELLACRAAVEGIPRVRHDVLLIADTEGEARASRLGLRTTDRVTAPLGRPTLAWRAVRALAASRPRPDVVQLWAHGIAPVARLALPRRSPVLGAPATLGVPAPSGPGRQELRAALGLRDDDLTVLLMADPVDETQSARFTFLIGLLDFAGRQAAGVLPAGARGIMRARAFQRRAVLECPIRYSSFPSAALAGACDVGVLHVHPWATASGPALERRRAAIRGAHRAGLPVVVPAHSGVADLCESSSLAEGAGLVCSGDRPADFAKVVARLFENHALRASISDAVRRHGDPAGDEALAALALSWESAAEGGRARGRAS